MSTRVYMFRHGRSVANETAGYVWGRCIDSPLAGPGVGEASRLGSWLRRSALAPARIFSSPTVRARRTAELAATRLTARLEIIEDPRLHEQDVGQWSGRAAIDVFTPACLRDIEKNGKDFTPPGGESMNDVGRRMLTWLDEQLTPADLIVFAFTHGGAIRALASTLHELSHAEAYPIRPANGSVSLVCLQDDRSWRFAYLGRDPADVLGEER